MSATTHPRPPSPANRAPANGGRRPGWWYPWIFIGAFIVVLAVNLVMMTAAVRTFSGLDNKQAYEEGRTYNHTLAMAEAQKRLGWQIDTQIRPQATPGAHAAEVVVSFRDHDGKPVTGLAVEAQFIRPTVEGHDAAMPLREQTSGRYGAQAVLAMAGQWEMHVTARRGDLEYQYDQRIMVP